VIGGLRADAQLSESGWVCHVIGFVRHEPCGVERDRMNSLIKLVALSSL